MPFINRRNFSEEKQIFWFAEGNVTTKNVAVTNEFLSPDAEGLKLVNAGMFVADVAGDIRFLPRLTLTAATSTGSKSVVGTPVVPFVAGDVLYVVEPQATVTIGGTVAEGDVVTITINGIPVTATAATTTLADLVALAAANINSNTQVKDLVKAIVSGGVIYLYAIDGVSTYSIAVAETSSAVTIAVGGSATQFAYGAAIGTVASVSVATNTITLEANASAVVPIGAHLGVRVNSVLGLDNHQREFNYETTQNFGLFTESNGVKENLLPYVDGDLKRRFSKLTFAAKV